MATYVNDLRLKEIATGDESGTWGTSTNTNLELIGEALGYGTEAITTNADTHASTVADGSTDAARSMYIKYTGTLDSACTITIGPNTMSRVHIIENATSGSQNIIIKQGSGAEVTIANGFVKMVYLDGAGSGAAVTEAFTDLSVSGNLLIDGATPTLTIGDAGAEDTKIVFDGNAQDFYIGLDDSADDLIIGLGSTVGTTPIISVDENKDVAIPDGGLTITTSDNSHQLALVSTDADANVGPVLELYRNSSSPADNDELGRIYFYGENDNDEKIEYVLFKSNIVDASDASEDSSLQIFTYSGGGQRNRIDLIPAETVFNEGSQDIDFRVESNGNANMLFVDGGNDVVNVGAATVETGDQFSIHGSGTNTTMRMYNTNAGSDGGLFIFQKNSSSPADGDILGDIRFHGNDDGGGMTQFARIKGESTDVSNGTEDGKMRFEITKAGTTREFLHLGPSNIVFNDDSEDIDLRIESADTTHFVFLDAGNNSFNIDDEGVAGVRTTINKNSSGARNVTTGSYNNILKIKNGNTANTIDRDATINFQVGGADEGYFSYIHSDGTNANNHGRFDLAARNGGTRCLMATFNPNVETVFNETGLAGQDFRIESDNLVNMFFLNAGTDSIHIGSSNSLGTTFLHVDGTTSSKNGITMQNASTTGSTFSMAFKSSSESVIGSITNDQSNVSFNTSSDYRLKENLTPISDGLERLTKLKPVKFDWKETGISSEGFLAHEVQEAGWVDGITGEKDGEKVQQMDYGRITPLIVKAVQEQQAQIDELKLEIASLKGE